MHCTITRVVYNQHVGLPTIRKIDLKKFLPHRELESHKGQNGRVLVIGGSKQYFGAPILAGLGALYSGSDLVYLLVPSINFDVSRNYYPDFIVRQYQGEYINKNTLIELRELLPKIDTVLIGPGITESPEIIECISIMLHEIETYQEQTPTIVLDAEAIGALAHIAHTLPLRNSLAKRIIITPNKHEFDLLIEEELPASAYEQAFLAQQYANNWGISMLVKSATDIIVCPGQQSILNDTGNPGMTVGGTGDVLAGVVASFMAQKCKPFDAACAAAYCLGVAGDLLEKSKGFNYSATDVALELPYVIKSFS